MNLRDIAKSRGTNLKKIAEKCDVPPSTLYAISSGDTNFENVGIGLFMKIADALDMTPEELYGSETHVDYAMVDMSKADSVDERELLALFRNMDDRHRALLMDNARSFAALSEKIEKGDVESLAGVEVLGI